MSAEKRKTIVLLGLARTEHIRETVHYLREKWPGASLVVVLFDREKAADLEGMAMIDRVVLMKKTPVFLLTGAQGVIKDLRRERFDALWVVARYFPGNPLMRLFILIIGAGEKRFRSTDGRSWSFADARRVFPEPPKHWFSKQNMKKYAIKLAYILGEISFPLLNLKKRKRPFREAVIRRILVLQMDLIGDVILATPCFTALKKNYPAATLDVMVSPWCRDLLAYNPYVDNTITYDARWFRDITPSRKKSNLIDGLSDILFRLRIFFKRYDIIFELKGESSNVLFAYLTGAPYRIGYCFRSEPRSKLPPDYVHYLLTTNALYPLGRHTKIHQVEHNLNVLRVAGFKVSDEDKELILNIPPEVEEGVNKLLERSGIMETDLLVCIHPGASRKLKMWRKEGFAAVADRLSEKYDARIIITGGRSEIGLAEEIAKLMQHPAYIAAGQTTLLEFICLLSKMDLVISNETSANSISSAVKTPVIVLMTGVPKLYGPYGVPHAAVVNRLPCRNILIEHCGICPYDKYTCLQTIDKDAVFAAAERLLKKASHRKAIKNK